MLKARPENAQDPDHDAGCGADQDDVERDAPCVHDRPQHAENAKPLSAVAEGHRQHHEHGG